MNSAPGITSCQGSNLFPLSSAQKQCAPVRLVLCKVLSAFYGKNNLNINKVTVQHMMLDARSSMLVKDPVSRIEHRASSLCLSG
ncbi:MAG: hypothetical protein AB1797_01455 [bacterium]